MSPPQRRSARRIAGPAAVGCLALAGAACGSAGSGPVEASQPPTIAVVSSIDSWGSILTQLGGDRVTETSIVASPEVRSKTYRPTPADLAHLAAAKVLVVNGIGYDPWAVAAARADRPSSKVVVDVGAVVGPAARGNPHQSYSATAVHRVVDALTAALVQADPGGAAYYASRRELFGTLALTPYDELERSISAQYAGVPIGASAAMAAPLATSLGLDVVTPPGYLAAVGRGLSPTPADAAVVADQIRTRTVRVFLDDVQDSTPGVAAAVKAAGKANVPVVTLTETLSPAGATFQAWQLQQLTALRNALLERH